jgi:hypothetical protein
MCIIVIFALKELGNMTRSGHSCHRQKGRMVILTISLGKKPLRHVQIAIEALGKRSLLLMALTNSTYPCKSRRSQGGGVGLFASGKMGASVFYTITKPHRFFTKPTITGSRSPATPAKQVQNACRRGNAKHTKHTKLRYSGLDYRVAW